MMTCPRCRRPLASRVLDRMRVWGCPGGCGRAATVEGLRGNVRREVVMELWQAARHAPEGDGCACPSCRKATRAVRVPAGYAVVQLDVCSGCRVIWFDREELEVLPSVPQPTGERLSPEAAAAVVQFEMEHHGVMKEAGDLESTPWGRRPVTPPDGLWKYVPGLFGLPVEFDAHRVARRPWATWIVCAVTFLVSALAFADLDAVARSYGFVAGDAWRLAGLTTVTSFFLHVGWVHLLGNLYFLYVFGDDVEDHLGPGRFLLLLLAATIMGNLVHGRIVGATDIPAIGASGGISGVITYYALRFPRRRIGVLYFYAFWFRLPAVAWLLFWVGWQVLALKVLGEYSNVAYGAHLGGAAAGAVWWIVDERAFGLFSSP